LRGCSGDSGWAYGGLRLSRLPCPAQQPCVGLFKHLTLTAILEAPMVRRLMIPLAAVCLFLSFCDDDSGTSPESTAWTAAQVDSLEWVVKKMVIDSFEVGLCFGMPSPPVYPAVDSVVQAHPGLADSIRAAYGVSGNLAVYYVICQLEAISCDYADGGFVVRFRNGQCCTVEEYAGRVWVGDGGQLQTDIGLTSSASVPC